MIDTLNRGNKIQNRCAKQIKLFSKIKINKIKSVSNNKLIHNFSEYSDRNKQLVSTITSEIPIISQMKGGVMVGQPNCEHKSYLRTQFPEDSTDVIISEAVRLECIINPEEVTDQGSSVNTGNPGLETKA